MLRDARPGDEAQIEAFLARHAETSMFLRSNLRAFGLEGSDDPRATRYWLQGDPVRAVFGRSHAGFLMAQAPEAGADDWAAFGTVLEGMSVAGITGAGDQVTTARAALGLNAHPYSLDRPEPLYRLTLDRLAMPDRPGTLRRARADEGDMLRDWVWDYDTGALGAPDTAATRARVQSTVERILTGDDTRILEVDGQPVAKTAFNARLPDMVQIGGVYTPPELRSRGHARRAAALHLAEARAQGVATAILFASGPAACRAYEAIGFERIGTYTLAILNEPAVVG